MRSAVWMNRDATGWVAFDGALVVGSTAWRIANLM